MKKMQSYGSVQTATLPKPKHFTTPPTYQTAPPLSFKFSEKKLIYFYMGVLLLLTYTLCRYVFESKITLMGDDTDYIMLGKALHQGDGYSNILMPSKAPYNHFPPGYPFFLSMVLFFSKGYLALKAANGFLLAGIMLLLLPLFRQFTQNLHLAFVACIFVLINQAILSYSSVTMSEMLYLFLATLSMYCYVRSNTDTPVYKNPWMYAMIVALAASHYTRTIALALLGGVMLSLLFQRKWLAMGMTMIGFVLLILPWQLRTAKLGGSTHFAQMLMKNPLRAEQGNMENMADWTARLLLNTKRYFSIEVPSLMFNFLPGIQYEKFFKGYWIWATAIVLLTVWGLIRLKNYRLLLFGYLAATFAIVLIYPEVWTGNRLIYHLVPVIAICGLYGAFDLATSFIGFIIKSPVPSWVQTTIAFIPLLGLSSFRPAINTMHQIAVYGTYDIAHQNYIKASEWIRDNTPEDAIVTCRKPSIFYHFGNRYATYFANTTDKGKLLADLQAKKVKYVILDGLGYAGTYVYLLPAIQAEPEKFKELLHLKNPDTYVFEYTPTGGYNGEYKDGKRQGKGEYKWADGSHYTGDWKEDVRAGQGTYYYSDGRKYVGNWKNDKANGQGTIYLTDKRKYIGEFKDYVFEGKGTFYDANGQIVAKGIWKNGQLIQQNF